MFSTRRRKIKAKPVSLIKNFWTILIASFVLGGAFVYASYHKILDPPDFAKIIYNYKLIPPQLINLAAIYLPWFELLAGVALIIGICRKGAALGVGLLAGFFILALTFNLYRGHPTICGCFDTHARGLAMTVGEKFWKMKREVALDFGFVALAAIVYFGSRLREEEAESRLSDRNTE